MTEQLQQEDVGSVDGHGIRIDVDQLSRLVRLRNRSQLSLLDAVSFSVSAEELVAIVGPRGAGKTTLLEAVAGGRWQVSPPAPRGRCVSTASMSTTT